MKSRISSIQTIIICFVLCALALGHDLASFEKHTTVKKLPNGLTIIICERPEAPVFSFFTVREAAGMRAPEASVTVPVMRAESVCENTRGRAIAPRSVNRRTLVSIPL